MKCLISRADRPLTNNLKKNIQFYLISPSHNIVWELPKQKPEKEARELTILWNFSLVQWLWPIQLGTLDFHCSWCIGFKKEVTKTSYNTIKKHKKTILIIFSPFLTQHTVWFFTSIYIRVSQIWKILEFSKSMILFLKFWLKIFGKLVSDLL